MLFHAPEYLLLLAVSALLWRVLPAVAGRAALLAASAVFYCTWNPVFYGVLVGVVWINHRIALDVAAAVEAGDDAGRARARSLVTGAVVFDLGLLVAFKYPVFLARNAELVLRAAGLDVRLDPGTPLLPLGVSFYTFQCIAYVVDVYREPHRRARSFAEALLFITLFFQLIAGPILRADELIPALRDPKPADGVHVREGLFLMLRGIVRKAVLADHLARIADPVFSAPAAAAPTAALAAVLAYTFQIYFDFAGYTDMARGSACFMGMRIPDNFNHPYSAAGPQDFWRRWHITLSRWLRDYLYIPLGGNRAGPAAAARNMLIVMGLGGLWHGAAWTFVVWGLYHGALLALERYAWVPFAARTLPFGPWATPVRRAASRVVTFALVAVGWVFFRAAGVTDAFVVLGGAARALAGGFDAAALPADLVRGPLVPLLMVYAVGAVVVELVPVLDRRGLRAPAHRARAAAAWALRGAAVAVFVAWFAVGFAARPEGADPFIYFQF